MRFIFPLLILFCSNASFGNTCLLEKYELFSSAQIKWQNDLTTLITSKTPKMQDVANLYRDEQLAYIAKDSLALKLLLKDSPSKVNTNEKVNMWFQLDNYVQENQANKYTTYNKLYSNVLANKHREDHPDGDRLRELMKTQIMPTNEFKILLANFMNSVDKINSIVCPAI
ncbi:hypothetical protein [Colwellia echini]|uniref:Uncharacterized protein n=1 Tax=Colwellia echini TaxID=1982103 RepID=A0ABY3MSH4_9GAMM|nr:hypothetical protein [Colwellia echini]TYK64145.1 hypothetical protein CWS31_017210 [Colwellia echini]